MIKEVLVLIKIGMLKNKKNVNDKSKHIYI